MAVLADLAIRLGLDLSDLGNDLRDAENTITGKLKTIAPAAGLAGGALIGGMVAQGIATGMDLSSAQNKLQRQLGLTEDTAAVAGESIGNVFADGFGGSIDEVQIAVEGIGSSIGDLSSMSQAEIEGMSKSALMLADTFGIDVAESTNAVGQLIKTGLVADGREGFDLLTAASQKFPQQMRAELAPTLTEYGTQFRNLGLDGAQSLGLIWQAVEAGAPSVDFAADALKEFSIEAVAGSDKIGDAWEELGMDAEKMFAKMGEGGPAATEALSETLSALESIEDPIERNAIAVELFGTKAEDLGDSLYAMNPATAAADAGLSDFAGSAEEATDSMEADPAQQMEKAMRQLSVTMGQTFLPIIEAVSSVLASNPGLFKVIVPVVLALATALGIAAAAQWVMNSALLANPITWIVLAITGLVAGILYLATQTEFFQTIWDAVWSGVSAAFEWVKNAISTGFEFLKNLFLNWTGPGLIIKHWETIKNAVGTAITWVKEKIKWGFDLMKNIFLKFTGPGLIVQHFGKIKNAVRSAMEFVKDKVEWGINKAKDIINGIKNIPDKMLGWFEGIGTGLKNAIVNPFKNGINAIIRGWNSLEFKIPGVKLPGPLPDFGGMTIGTPNVPLLAKGGVTTGATLAMIGEGKEQEAVLPLSRLRGMLEEVKENGSKVQGVAQKETRIVIDITGGDEMLKQWFRKAVRTDNLLTNIT